MPPPSQGRNGGEVRATPGGRKGALADTRMRLQFWRPHGPTKVKSDREPDEFMKNAREKFCHL